MIIILYYLGSNDKKKIVYIQYKGRVFKNFIFRIIFNSWSAESTDERFMDMAKNNTKYKSDIYTF